MHGTGPRMCQGPGCAAAPVPGVLGRTEQGADTQGLTARTARPPTRDRRARHLQLFFPSGSPALTPRERARATTSSSCHPEHSLVSESKFNRPEGDPVVTGPAQSQESVTAATAPRRVLMLGNEGGAWRHWPGHGEATMALERMKGNREVAGATHTSCKARPPAPLLLCTVLGPWALCQALRKLHLDPRCRRQGTSAGTLRLG